MEQIDMKIIGAPSTKHIEALEQCGGIATFFWNSSIETRVLVKWTSLPDGVIASGEPSQWSEVGTGEHNALYTIASAKAVIKQDFNDVEYGDGRFDVLLRLDSKTKWHVEMEGEVPADKYDLVTICLHELQHGLYLFSESLLVDERRMMAIFSRGTQQRYDSFLAVETEGGDCSIKSYAANPKELYRALTSRKLWFRTSQRRIARLYAPSRWIAGSSIYHIDPRSRPRLMAPSANTGYKYRAVDPTLLHMQNAIRNWSEPGAKMCGRGEKFDPPALAPRPSFWAFGVVMALIVALLIRIFVRIVHPHRIPHQEVIVEEVHTP